MNIKEAMKVLSFALQNDPDYARSWHANIAMVAQDAGAPHHESNVRAADFMKRVFGVDTTREPARTEIRNTCEERENLLPNNIDFEEYMDSFAIHVLVECVQNRLKQKRQEGQAGWYCDLGELNIKDRIRDKVSVQHMSTKDIIDVACYAAMLLAQKVIKRKE